MAVLAEHGVQGIPVIEPIPTTLHVAAALARSRLSHGNRTYP